MNRFMPTPSCVHQRVPRASGDEPDGEYLGKAIRWVFPAPAGMNRNYDTCPVNNASVPRASGDEPD